MQQRRAIGHLAGGNVNSHADYGVTELGGPSPVLDYALMPETVEEMNSRLKRTWKGGFIGGVIGLLSGGGVGYLTADKEKGDDPLESAALYGLIGSGMVGFIAGGISWLTWKPSN